MGKKADAFKNVQNLFSGMTFVLPERKKCRFFRNRTCLPNKD